MTDTPLRAALAAAVALFLAVGTAGCLIGASSTTEYEGVQISEETFREIQPGATEDYVLALLGEPTTRANTEGGELWKWEYSKTATSSGSLLFVFGSESKTASRGAVYCRFEDGVVEKIWRD